MSGQHFPGCHPEDTQAPEAPEGYQPQETENCWHCGTPTSRGCNCAECWDGADYIPPSASYHCPTCGRWWAWMTGLNITEITFGAQGADTPHTCGLEPGGVGYEAVPENCAACRKADQ